MLARLVSLSIRYMGHRNRKCLKSHICALYMVSMIKIRASKLCRVCVHTYVKHRNFDFEDSSGREGEWNIMVWLVDKKNSSSSIVILIDSGKNIVKTSMH